MTKRWTIVGPILLLAACADEGVGSDVDVARQPLGRCSQGPDASLTIPYQEATYASTEPTADVSACPYVVHVSVAPASGGAGPAQLQLRTGPVRPSTPTTPVACAAMHFTGGIDVYANGTWTALTDVSDVAGVWSTERGCAVGVSETLVLQASPGQFRVRGRAWSSFAGHALYAPMVVSVREQ